MKKILFLLSLAALLGACNDTETPAPESPFARAESHVRSLIEEFGDYNPAEAESMIAGKMLTLSVRLEYNESRTEVIGVPYAFGESDEGVQADRYLLRRDGSCTRYYWTDGGWLRTEGSWSLDNEARTLQIMDDIVEIVALGPYSIIWDKETCEIPGSKPRSLIDNYIIEPIDPNFPDPRPDTHYEEIEVEAISYCQMLELAASQWGYVSEYWAPKYYDDYRNNYVYITIPMFYFKSCDITKSLTPPFYVTLDIEGTDFYLSQYSTENYNVKYNWVKYEEFLDVYLGICDELSREEYPIYAHIVAFCTNPGTFNFTFQMYHPETDRYFESKPLQMVLEEDSLYYYINSND